jgi:hypothetical protein
LTFVVIVGAGPLSTYAMSHLAALLPDAAHRGNVRITVIDRGGRFGAGDVHSDRQAQTSYMNRVAGQIAFAPDESNRSATRLLPRELRPTFHEWYCRRAPREPSWEPLAPTDVPRRYLHGIALREQFDRYVKWLRALPGVDVELVRAEVMDVRLARTGPPFVVHADGRRRATYLADHVLFVTGHSVHGTPAERVSAAAPRTRVVADPYPLAEQLTEATAPPGCTVGIEGLGLTAIDVILHLTEGRGGTFERVADGMMRYVPGGREPAAIYAASPSGEPVCGRAVNQKVADPAAEHRAVFFTGAAIAQLRRAAGLAGRLDFRRHLLPLVVLEMAYVYYRALLGDRFATAAASATDGRLRRFLSEAEPAGEAGVAFLLKPVQDAFDREVAAPTGLARQAFRRVLYPDPLTGRGPSPWGHAAELSEHRFDWRRALHPVTVRPPAAGTTWHEHVLAHLRRDVAYCAQGNVTNPLKAACDGVWRDLRTEICLAVDDGGLTPTAQRDFTNRDMRYYNRLSNGSGLVPLRKVLALAECGLLDLSLGPRPDPEFGPGGRLRLAGPVTGAACDLDVLVRARIALFRPDADAAPLYRNLMAGGLVRQWRNPGGPGEPDLVPGGLDLDRDFHPRNADGGADARLTFLGAPAEGLRLFQLSAARPHADSYVLNNVIRWAEDLVGTFASGSDPGTVRGGARSERS